MKTKLVTKLQALGQSIKAYAQSTTGFIDNAINVGLTLVGLAVLFAIAAGVVPTVLSNLTNLSTSGIALGFLFASGGVISLLLGVWILVRVIQSMGFGTGRTGGRGRRGY